MKLRSAAEVAQHRRAAPEATPVCIPTDVAVTLALPLGQGLRRLARASPHDTGPPRATLWEHLQARRGPAG